MSAPNPDGTPLITIPHQDANTRYNSLSMGTTNQGIQPAPEAHQSRSEDQGKGDSGLREGLSKYIDLGGQHTQRDEGECKNVLLLSRNPIPSNKEASKSACSTGTREGKESHSGPSTDSVDITIGGHGVQLNPPTDNLKE